MTESQKQYINLRIEPEVHYERRENEMKAMLNILNLDINDTTEASIILCDMPMVFIEQALDERIQELEASKNKGFF